MAGGVAAFQRERGQGEHRGALTEPRWVRWLLLGTALTFLTFFLFVPLLLVFFKAFEDGFQTYIASISERAERPLMRSSSDRRPCSTWAR